MRDRCVLTINISASNTNVTVIFDNFWERFVYNNACMNKKYSSEVSAGYKQQIKDIKDLK